MTINPSKFAYLFFKDLRHALPQNYKLPLSGRVSFSTELPVLNESHWKEWMGSINWNDIKKSNAVIETKIETQAPDILDGENKELESYCYWAWRSLQLTGPFRVGIVNSFTGSIKAAGTVDIRRWTQNKDWLNFQDFSEKLTEKNIAVWPHLFSQLLKMYNRVKNNGEFIRVNRGLWYFYKGLEEDFLGFKLPNFVRSLEALILPDKGKTTKQFKTRVSKWWPNHNKKNIFPKDKIKALETLYDIRCDFDHLHGLKKEYSDAQYLLGYQAEATARNAYQQILATDEELDNFATDDKIRQYWKG